MLPRGAHYLEALGTWSSLGGPMLRAEAGTRWGPLGFFAFGEASNAGPRIGAGARLTW